MKDPVLLVIDDDELVIQAIRLMLPSPWRMMACRDPGHLPERGFHAALIDMHLTGDPSKYEGLEVLRALRSRHPRLECAAMSGDLDLNLMEKCLSAGATRFLAKPLAPNEVLSALGKMEAFLNMDAGAWIGSGPESVRIQRQIAQLRDESGPILIEGESGSGKEVCAQLIHAQEDGGPMVVINVASLPENLFESEFFGHMRGAFTGADHNKTGLAESAQDGDLFLDEIDALSPAMQAKLLRFLETGEVRRLGGTDTIFVRTRVIAATNRNLNTLVAEGKFREDLLWRLSGKKIVIPPLRERRSDIPALVIHFTAMDKHRKKEIHPEAMEALCAHDWPGNVRELKRVCEQLMLTAPLPVIRRQDVTALLRPSVAASPVAGGIDFSRGIASLVNEFEAQIIQKAFGQQQDIDGVARLLKISRSSLYKKIKDHDIQWRANNA
jgi:DNA-binding NtrC family response regulator